MPIATALNSKTELQNPPLATPILPTLTSTSQWQADNRNGHCRKSNNWKTYRGRNARFSTVPRGAQWTVLAISDACCQRTHEFLRIRNSDRDFIWPERRPGTECIHRHVTANQSTREKQIANHRCPIKRQTSSITTCQPRPTRWIPLTKPPHHSVSQRKENCRHN